VPPRAGEGALAPLSPVATTNTSSTFASASRIAAARQAEYVGFLHRHPFATDAYELGFITGIREDYNLQIDGLSNVATPIGMLDNDFHDPDLERYVGRFEKYEPDVAVLGDAETQADAVRFVETVGRLRKQYPDTRYIIVPKSRAAFEELADADVTLGYSMGYSEIQAEDITDPLDWRGLDIHLLGGSPDDQYEVIQKLTRPAVTGAPPGNIVGLDWNGAQKGAYFGEFWSPNGWMPADTLTIRETVRRSLHEIKRFWQERGVWPESTPKDKYGPAVQKPDDMIWAATGRCVESLAALENAIVVEYEDGRVYAYRSEHERGRVEYHEGRIDHQAGPSPVETQTETDTDDVDAQKKAPAEPNPGSA